MFDWNIDAYGVLRIYKDGKCIGEMHGCQYKDDDEIGFVIDDTIMCFTD